MANESSDDFSDIDTPQHAGATPHHGESSMHDFDADFDEMNNELDNENENENDNLGDEDISERDLSNLGKTPDTSQMQLSMQNDESQTNLNELTPMSGITDNTVTDQEMISDGDMSPLNYNKQNKINKKSSKQMSSNNNRDINDDSRIISNKNSNDSNETRQERHEKQGRQGRQGRSQQHSTNYYNARMYDSLEVSNEIKRLFEYIELYKPIEIELETQLKPFIPDYIPAIGNVDGFIKPARPDSKEDNLGLISLDEPILKQSDPSTLDLQLRSMSKLTNMKFVKIRSIERADKNPSKITNWIDSIKKINSQKAGKGMNNNIQFQNEPMPDLEQLMQPWDTAMDQYFREILNSNNNAIPPYDIELSLTQYAAILCNIFDIPTYSENNIVPSLNCMFSLYAMFKQSNQMRPN